MGELQESLMHFKEYQSLTLHMKLCSHSLTKSHTPSTIIH